MVVRDTETRTIGENSFGGASRRTTLKRGDDQLDIELGGQHVSMTMDQTVNAGTTITVTANLEITLRVGASIIKIDPSGIMITAPTVNIQALSLLAMHGNPTVVG